ASVIGALAQELVAAIDASGGTEEIAVAAELSEANSQLEDLRVRRDSATAARHDADALFHAVQEARLDVVGSEFARLSPVAQDIYTRLDPHPTFTEVELVPEMFRAVGTATAEVRDSFAEVKANPMLVFSTAQANIAGMS
ncbi:MAG: hypothetical protein ACYDBS_11050, partial [Acidimicrobiales bacterium]